MTRPTQSRTISRVNRKHHERCTVTPHQKKKRRKETGYSLGDWLFGIGLLLVVIAVAVGSVWWGLAPRGQQIQSREQSTVQLYTLPPNDPTLTTCISESNVVMRLQVTLKIVINGSQIRIPAKIGDTQSCLRPVHTTDASGTISVESPVNYPYTLKDFFAVWNQHFSKTRIFFFQATGKHTITMTVNGQPSSDYENHVLSDGEQIVITFT